MKKIYFRDELEKKLETNNILSNAILGCQFYKIDYEVSPSFFILNNGKTEEQILKSISYDEYADYHFIIDIFPTDNDKYFWTGATVIKTNDNNLFFKILKFHKMKAFI